MEGFDERVKSENEEWSGGHAHGSVHICQCRGGHGQVGVNHLRGKVGRVRIIQVDDSLKDTEVDDPVGGALLLSAMQ
jgi:hypothetical protein